MWKRHTRYFAPENDSGGGAGAAGAPGAGGNPPQPGGGNAPAPGAGTPPGTAAPPPASTPANTPEIPGWMSQYPEAHRAALATMGFKSPAEVSAKLLDYDKTLGGNRVVVPQDWAKASPEEKAAWRKAHGVSDKADEYLKDLPTEGVKYFDKAAYDWFRATAHELGAPPFLARALYDKWNERSVKQGADAETEIATAVQREDEGLHKKWGATYDANMDIAKAGAAHFGFSAEAIDALQRVQGYAAVMEGFHRVGQGASEDAIRPSGGAPGSGFIATPEAAKSEKDRMMGDTKIAGILRQPDLRNAEHRELVKKFERLQEMESGVKFGAS